MYKKINRSNFDLGESIIRTPPILCSTLEAAKDFISYLGEFQNKNQEYEYCNTLSRCLSNWNQYRENTCYCIHPSYHKTYEYWIGIVDLKTIDSNKTVLEWVVSEEEIINQLENTNKINIIKKINKNNFDLEDIIRSNPYIYCPTLEIAKDLMLYLDDFEKKNQKGYKFCQNLINALEDWNYYKEDTCYHIHNHNPYYYQNPYKYWVMFENVKKIKCGVYEWEIIKEDNIESKEKEDLFNKIKRFFIRR